MDAIVVEDVPFRLKEEALLDRLRLEPGCDQAQEALRLLALAVGIARPMAVYRPVFIEGRGEDFVVIQGERLTSRVLAVNTRDVHRVFPYVATCGRELEEWSVSLGDMLLEYYADAIKQEALSEAMRMLCRHMDETFRLGKTSSMAPGSLEDWPLSEQVPLFHIIGDVEGMTGVHLTESCLMLPVKSVSGIRFTTETKFESCQLCSREGCPGRRAAYDPELKVKYGLRR
ncbi:MAG: vitamin B12 dependent methionine synthase [Planctomycetes bacterium]|nr:vitamin B12 dependent methionine synthase [Planctomycetota bacterium]